MSGTSWHGRSEAEVRAADVRTFWYMGRRDGAYGVVFRDGRLLAAFETTDRELDDLLARKLPC